MYLSDFHANKTKNAMLLLSNAISISFSDIHWTELVTKLELQASITLHTICHNQMQWPSELKNIWH
jgi:hypothetical protein